MNAARSRIGSRYHRLAALLAVAAVLLRCVVAPGFMLDLAAAARGELQLVICTSAGLKSIALAPDQKQSPDRRANTDICPYAAPGHVGKLADPVVLAGERLSPAFDAPARDTASSVTRPYAFAARAPPNVT